MNSPQPLSDEEREAIIVGVQSVFTKLRNLYHAVEPVFQSYGFTAPSAGVIARDLSEKIEAAIVQHCPSFTKGRGHADLTRAGADWEVKICKGGGLTINQSKQISGENYIVVNYTVQTKVNAVWVLWDAQDVFFCARKANTNARSVLKGVAAGHVEVLFQAPSRMGQLAAISAGAKTAAKAQLAKRQRHKAS